MPRICLNKNSKALAICQEVFQKPNKNSQIISSQSGLQTRTSPWITHKNCTIPTYHKHSSTRDIPKPCEPIHLPPPILARRKQLQGEKSSVGREGVERRKYWGKKLQYRWLRVRTRRNEIISRVRQWGWKTRAHRSAVASTLAFRTLGLFRMAGHQRRDLPPLEEVFFSRTSRSRNSLSLPSPSRVSLLPRSTPARGNMCHGGWLSHQNRTPLRSCARFHRKDPFWPTLFVGFRPWRVIDSAFG